MSTCSFIFMYRICRCICNEINNFVCGLFLLVSWYLVMAKSHTRCYRRLSHITAYNVIPNKKFKRSFNDMQSANSQATPGVIINYLKLIKKRSISWIWEVQIQTFLYKRSCRSSNMTKLSKTREVFFFNLGLSGKRRWGFCVKYFEDLR